MLRTLNFILRCWRGPWKVWKFRRKEMEWKEDRDESREVWKDCISFLILDHSCNPCGICWGRWIGGREDIGYKGKETPGFWAEQQSWESHHSLRWDMWDWEQGCRTRKEVEFIFVISRFRALWGIKIEIFCNKCLLSEAHKRSLGCRFGSGNHIYEWNFPVRTLACKEGRLKMLNPSICKGRGRRYP